jgi:outer membrane protein assembly factor BamB
MNSSRPNDVRPLQLWPGVVFAALQCLGWFLVPVLLPDQAVFGLFAAVLGAVAIVLWWTFFSRAQWRERLGIIALMVVSVVVTSRLLHASVAGAGMGMMFFFLAPTLMAFTLVLGVLAGRRFGVGACRAVIAASVLIGAGFWTLLRTDGVVGAGGFDFHWRWTPTAEERLLAQATDEPKPALPEAVAAAAAEPVPETPAAVDKAAAPVVIDRPHVPEWPGFRGANRDSVLRGVRIDTDWTASPPVQIWRRAVGPGWSSFAVDDDIIYTQEQRGEEEMISAYRLNSGQPVWRHRDRVRFWESNGGPGPRGTPTLHDGRLYAAGATGLVNALDARTGALLWSHNGATDTGAKLPEWGFSSSPLVIDDLVIVATSGRLVAYDIATGKMRWTEKSKGGSYSSPHLMTIDGVTQVVLVNGGGASSFAPDTGKVLWEHDWPGGAIVQPAVIANGNMLISSNDMMGGVGTRRIAVTQPAGGWKVEERWTSNGLKPYYNDLVIHKGHAYGFDGSILAAVDLEDGKRKWKGGRYGNGQLLLLPDQDLLLVLSEEGELALVKATPDQFSEVARFKAIEGKTWNHPVLVRDIVLVRNGEEMAAFRLTLSK